MPGIARCQQDVPRFEVFALLGGPYGARIGNFIQLQFGPVNNWPMGATLSIVLMLWIAAIALVFPKPVREPGARSLPALSRNAEALEGEARTTNVRAMGAISIQIYGLNRLGLVQARTRV